MLEELNDVPCILALGDPGLGKSWAIEEYAAAVDRRLQSARANGGQSDTLLALDGTEFDSRESLLVRVFRHADIAAWRAGDGLLYLILDSLDEVPTLLAPLCQSILDELSDLPVERLRLRVGCRTAVLPMEFRDGLRRRFEEVYGRAGEREDRSEAIEGVVTSSTSLIESDDPKSRRAQPVVFTEIEIAQLTRTQVRIAAQQTLGSESEADRFLLAVEDVGVGPFAARPLTLAGLLGEFSSGGALTTNQISLFRDLCLQLCRPERVRPGTTDLATYRTTPAERYRLAGRISAALLLGNRRTIWLGQSRPPSTSLLDVADLTGTEHIDGVVFRVDEAALWEAVNTALFTGADELGVAMHLGFAEFMTADWITARDMPLKQVLSLLVDPTDRDRQVVPQLRQVAAWLGAMRQDVLNALAETEPDIVLWSDVVHIPEDGRPALVQGLLNRSTANRVQNPPFGVSPGFERLNHDGLADQLRPVIQDRAAPSRTRDLALDIAYACQAGALAPDGVRLALTTGEPIELRYAAARLVAQVGTEADRRLLSPLATTADPVDELENLKGAALRATWRLFSPPDLFTTLTPLRTPNHGGAYGAALMEIADGLTADYVVEGARWLASGERGGIYLDGICRRVFRLALDALDNPDVLSNLATYALSRMSNYSQLLDDAPSDDGLSSYLEQRPALRRRLLAAIINAGGASPSQLVHLAHESPRLIASDDVSWALAELVELPVGDQRREGWRVITQSVFDPSSSEHVQAAFGHRGDPDVVVASLGLIEAFSTPEEALAGVATNHVAQQEAIARRQAAAKERDAARAAEEAGPMGERLIEALKATGSVDRRWPFIVQELLRTDKNHFRAHLSSDSRKDVVSLRGSALATSLVNLAADYLVNGTVPADPFPNRATAWGVVFAFMAGLCLHELEPDRLIRVPAEVWARWARALIGYRALSEDQAAHLAILRSVAIAVPDAARDEVLRLLERVSGEEGSWLDDAIGELVTSVPHLSSAVVNTISRGAYGAPLTEYLLQLLLSREVPGSLPAAQQLLAASGAGTAEGASTRASAAFAALLVHAPAVGWNDLWPRLVASDSAAIEFLSYAARNRESLPRAALAQLTDQQVADLYLLVARLFPPEEDPWHVGVHSPGARDHIQHWRSALLYTLDARKTQSAVKELERIAHQEPVRDHLIQIWLQAKAALRGDRWRGTAPRELMSLAARPDLRLVESGSQLLDVLEESLYRLQEELQGQWRAVAGLWNEDPKGNRPKAEDHLSNEVARHLRRDLARRQLVVGRELVLQVGVLGGAAGLRTDIDVVARASSGTDRTIDEVRALVEVKGSWNPTVLTAMDLQLVRSYLDPHRIRFGLYLVGRYTCKSWKPGPDRTRSIKLGSDLVLAAALRLQAEGLTTSTRLVRAFVLNTALPDSINGSRRGSKVKGPKNRPRATAVRAGRSQRAKKKTKNKPGRSRLAGHATNEKRRMRRKSRKK